MKPYERLLLNNKNWANEKVESNPEYFKRSAEGQEPQFLWIGCSDSRVPLTDLTKSETGDIFVHRNIANMVIPSDTNSMSVLQYAVEVLKVPYVVVCGHYGCGGIKASISGKSMGLIDEWLKHIKEVYYDHQDAFENDSDDQAKLNKLAELNVKAQLRNIGETDIVKNAWKQFEGPTLLGWIYDLETGLIKELDEVKSEADL